MLCCVVEGVVGVVLGLDLGESPADPVPVGLARPAGVVVGVEQPVVQAIGEWAATWSFTEPRAEELDPSLLIVWMARHVDRGRLPPDRTGVQFDFRDPRRLGPHRGAAR